MDKQELHSFTCFKRGEEKMSVWSGRESRILVPLVKEDTRREYAYLADIGNHAYDDYLQLIRSTLRRPIVIFARYEPEV